MTIAQMVREEVDRLVRPGQPGTSVSAHRSVRGAAGGGSGVRALVAADGEQGGTRRYAVYGRGRYGRDFYG